VSRIGRKLAPEMRLTYKDEMAEQKFDFFERRAFWEAHGRRCAYCREPLSFEQLEIDHIMAESLLKDAERWERVRAEHGLPADFDLRGYENLQPSCASCNARKRAQPLAPGRAAIELGVARRVKGHVVALVERFKRADKADKLRFAIAGAIGSGELSEHDIALAIATARKTTGAFRLSATFQLFGDEPVGEISRADYERYLGVKMSLPLEMENGLRLVTDDHAEVLVSTLSEFQDARANGFYALSNFERDVAFQRFERPLLFSIFSKGRELPNRASSISRGSA
jgi:5-methylcytosine-specific restriction endonuclease McrA